MIAIAICMYSMDSMDSNHCCFTKAAKFLLKIFAFEIIKFGESIVV